MTSMSYRKMAILFAAIALVAAPALLHGAKPASKYQPGPPLLVKAPQPNAGKAPATPTDVIEEPDEPPPGGGGPVITTSSWSVDWEIPDWGHAGTDAFTATMHDGVVQSVTIQSDNNAPVTVTRAEMEALGVPMPAAPTFAKANGMQNATMQSTNFTQTIPSIYGNSVTIRGTVNY